MKVTKGRPWRRYYGFVDAAIAADPDSSRSREVLLLDCIDAEAFDANANALREDNNLALIRVMSTRRRLEQDFNFAFANEGDWVELTVGIDRGSPRAWVMPASTGYESETWLNIRSIAKLPPSPDGSPAASVAARLESECSLGSTKRFDDIRADFLATLVCATGEDMEIRSVDVGQASCNVFIRDGNAIGYFDVGAPLYRNQKSFHGRLCHKPPQSGFVILSHWDFDHFDLGRRVLELQQLDWLAPDQPVGPNTLRFQRQLGQRLSFFSGARVNSTVALRPGLATNPKDRNGSGYSMRVSIDSEIVVMTGDCAYDKIDPQSLLGVTALTIPHHGGASGGALPPASGSAVAVASYGIPNCYRHPDETFLAQHEARGWNVSRTAADISNGKRRRSRTLYRSQAAGTSSP